MDPWNLLQALGSFLFLASLAPQFYRTIQRGRAEDVSLTFLLILLAGSVVLIPYTLHTRQWFFVASYAGNVVVWSTVLYYRVRPRSLGQSPRGL